MTTELRNQQKDYSKTKNADEKKSLGQYFTDSPIAVFMSSLIDIKSLPKDEVRLLDCGAGYGMLTVSTVMHLFKNGVNSINATLYEIDREIIPGLIEVLDKIKLTYRKKNKRFNYNLIIEDYVIARPDLQQKRGYDLAVINPPYFKYSAKDSIYAKKTADLFKGDPNIYASFLAITLSALNDNGQIVAITPRSFLNGLYFKGFRKYLLENSNIELIHVFKSRKDVFVDSDILQENIIFKVVKNKERTAQVSISSCNSIEELGNGTLVSYPRKIIIDSSNSEDIIRIPETELDFKTLQRAEQLPSNFTKEGYFISTGPVVEHRARNFLAPPFNSIKEKVPLLRAHNIFIEGINWDGEHKKDITFKLDPGYEKHLLPNERFLVVKRFTSKDERRRLVAGVYEPIKQIDYIGVTNKLNYLGRKDSTMSEDEVRGLSVLFNSKFMDDYYRCISGNTQVNATDVRIMKTPTREQIIQLGVAAAHLGKISYETIEEIITPIYTMEDKKDIKLEEAKQILTALKLPKGQTNNRSAWVFLALANITPEKDWDKCEAPLLPTYKIMEFIRDEYGMDYKPNSRETIRRQTLHQFEQARIIDRNRDDPNRPTNSKDNNYSLNEPIKEILRAFPDGDWNAKVDEFLLEAPSLKEAYKKKRDLAKIPVKLPNGKELSLSPGKHNQLHADIVHEFCPRFIGEGGIVLYIGDTASSRKEEGGKLMHLEEEYLESLGVTPMSHDKLPDVVVYDEKNGWLFLIEAVTSHGPVSPKRWAELEAALSDCKVGKVYVTAFPDKKEFKKNISDIAWETEVWISEDPDHMIHFNGDRFLGPH